MDPVSADDPAEKDNFANRKLIRPTLPLGENHGNHGNHTANAAPMQERRERHNRAGHERQMHDRPMHDRPMPDRGGAGKKPAPPDQTNAENFYYQKQMQSRTPMVIVLRDGEEIHGIIEWYDRHCIKVNRENGEPNLMIYKPAIKYMFKEGEGSH